ncbi:MULTISPECIES: putative Ig domain-containing protein [unclassified Nostoc]|uniref:putative Ig domain-containing protein n=1 Tax=unclassified Nostoc TaxID=2593658 RepID=UPI0026210F6A|nr:putative Ig domain-containing protein [Nostoc sp. S13]MDF5736071.1 putative Ig domain-containing protein [Nostoc sp. S13]
MDNLPLLELFTQLRKAGLPLGVDDYQAVLKALQAGYGIENKAALARLCRTLWVKSKQDKQLFDYHFEKIIFPNIESINPSILLTSSTLIFEKSPKENTPEEGHKSFQIYKYLILLRDYVIPVGIFILIFGIAVRVWHSNHVPIFTSRPETQIEKGNPYKYIIKAHDVDKGDIVTIEAVRYPSWLTFKNDQNGTATLSGIEGNNVGNCKDETAVSSDGKSPQKKPKSYSVELRVTDNHGAMMSQNFEIKVDSDVKETSILLFILESPSFMGFAITLAIACIILLRENTEPNAVQNSLPSEPENITPEKSSSEALGNTNNEKKVLEAQQKTSQAETVKPLNRFIQITEYPPLTRRQMKQSWRYLRRMLREGVPTELDVEATIEQISRQGVLVEPVIVPRRVNRSKLLLFIDQDGSMMPFQNLSHQLAETAIRGGRLEDTNIYYFHNCPIDYLYRDRYYQMPEKIDDILNSLRFPYTSALIFSDAGAARGGLNPERREVTAQFLEQLRQQVRHIAWLNPMPRYRWFGTTAGEIARLVAMFELSRQGLYSAISVLRGQSGHFGVSKL